MKSKPASMTKHQWKYYKRMVFIKKLIGVLEEHNIRSIWLHERFLKAYKKGIRIN